MSVLTRPDAPITSVGVTKGDKPPLDYRIWDVTGDYCLFNENGEPVAQNPDHYEAQDGLGDMVASLLIDRPAFTIYQDVLLAWDKDHPNYWCAPDLAVFTTKPVARPGSGIVRLWETPTSPIFVLEVISPNGEFGDLVTKRSIYETLLRVPEYIIHSPVPGNVYLQGYRLVGSHYEAVTPDEQQRIWSEQLRGWFGLDEEGKLRIWDASGRPTVKIRESVAQTKTETLRADAEARRAEEQARRADEETRRADEETRRAEEQARRADEEAILRAEETRRADEEALRANEEARLRAAAEKELRELRALLKQRSNG